MGRLNDRLEKIEEDESKVMRDKTEMERNLKHKYDIMEQRYQNQIIELEKKAKEAEKLKKEKEDKEKEKEKKKPKSGAKKRPRSKSKKAREAIS